METTVYAQVGGDEVLRALVDRFYDLMDRIPAAREIRAMHEEDLATARDRMFRFLQLWTGGPREPYLELRGHPRLRARHLPFPIDAEARDAWLHCMRLALDEEVADPALRDRLMAAFTQIAEHMRNR